MSRLLTRLTSHARIEAGYTGPLGPGGTWGLVLAGHGRTKRKGGAEGTWWRGAQPLRLTTLCYPVLVRAIPSLLAMFALDGTKADVSSPNGYHWVWGREDASTRTARRWGVFVVSLRNSLRYGRGQSWMGAWFTLYIPQFETQVEETALYS